MGGRAFGPPRRLRIRIVTDVVESPVGRLRGDALSLEEMQALPIFEGCSAGLLKKNVGAVVRRRYAPGDIVCREGEFGSTAFFILEGSADVFLKAPVAHPTSRTRSPARKTCSSIQCR